MIKITTSNSTYMNGELVASSNEIHEILGLQNINHIFATIDSIAKNNVKHNKENSELESITVSVPFTNRGLLNEIVTHYENDPIMCKVNPGLYLIS